MSPLKGPGPSAKFYKPKKTVKMLTREERQEILKTQEVLRGCVFDIYVVDLPGIVELIEIVTFQ